METLQTSIEQVESAYLSTVESILKQPGHSRVKIALIYKAHIKCLVAIDDVIAESKLATPPANAAASN
jgi:hypothetical protein